MHRVQTSPHGITRPPRVPFSAMAKQRKNAALNNRKMTDFFTQQPRPSQSSQPSPSTAPVSSTCSTLKNIPRSIASRNSMRSPQPGKRTVLQPSRISSMKENACPSCTRTTALNREMTYSWSSPDSAVPKSVANPFLPSDDNGIVETVPNTRYNCGHRSLQLSSSRSPRKGPPRKRKKPEGIQSDDGDVVDTNTMGSIHVSSRATIKVSQPYCTYLM